MPARKAAVCNMCIFTDADQTLISPYFQQFLKNKSMISNVFLNAEQ